MRRLEGKTAVVTGGGGGIGGATCHRFASEGARVAWSARCTCITRCCRAWRNASAAASSTSRPMPRASARRARPCTPCKGGLVSFSKTIAREHARHGITVNVVCPGPTDTALLAGFAEGAGDPAKLLEAFRRAIPFGRLGQPDDLVGAILYFASDESAFVTGQVLSVSGGLTMAG